MDFTGCFGPSLPIGRYLDFLLRLVAAGFCGAAIGAERSRRFKEAGIRTHILVCVAAALMMIVSKYGFDDLAHIQDGTRTSDPARIAAQVVSGISFLGAGMIFKTGSSIKGLTTAAGIWATAGIGLALGSGMYWLGLMATLLVAIFQYTFHALKIGADSYKSTYLEILADDSPEFFVSYNNMITGLDAQIIDMQVNREGDKIRYAAHLKMKDVITHDEIVSFFEDYPEIRAIVNKPD